jgi:4-amino-4-deoxy-L-arabinose transferase-like glycosyltransferase
LNNQSKTQNPPKARRAKSKITWLILIILIFTPRLLNLDVFLTADEPFFLDHAREFAAGLTSGDLSLTLGIGYPGVTVAWWTAPVVGLFQSELQALVAGRVVTALVNGLLMLVLYALACSLLGRWPAFLGVGLLALDPYTLAYSRLFHLEVPLTLFMTLTGLAFLLWLRDARWQWVFLAGLFTGLALLTKSTALLLGPMLVAMLAGWLITSINENAFRRSILEGVWYHLAGLMGTALIAIIVFFILWPAMWSDPTQALDLTFGKLLNDQEAGIGNFGMFWMGHFVQDPGPAFYPVAFLLKATPWLLAGLLLSLWSIITRRTPSDTRPIPISLWLFALTYLFLMTLASKKSVRYLLPAFPTFYLLAGLAFYQFSESVGRRISRWSPRPLRVARFASPLRLLLILPLFLFALFYHPYYFTYYNPLLLGWLWAPQTLLVGWGEGLDQAARYLDEQPAGSVATWYEWIFPLMYHHEVQDTSVENLIKADHAVLYINQVQRDLPNPNIIDYFRSRRQPEYTVRLAGIDYAWVYPGPIAGFRSDPAPQYALGGDFGGEVHLLGYDLSQPQLSGQPLIVTLYWRVLATPPANRFVYLRLVDAQGRVWAKTDSPPVMGLWPVSRWQPEMLVEDAQELPIPPGTPPGLYRLEVGWYDPASGQPLSASGQPLGQGGGLLLGEVQLGWQSLTAPADLPHMTDTRLAPNARLVGYDAPPATATSGDLLSIHLVWREANSFLNFAAASNNYAMFEWRQVGRRVAEQLDPLPFPIEQWGRNALLLSQHEVIVPPTLADGRYELVVMLHTSSDPAGEPFSLGMVEVTSPSRQFDLPTTAMAPVGPAQLDQGVALAGYDLQPSAQSLQLNLHWQTKTPLSMRYKVFAQLLAADNTLIAQSDTFPALGQRPTTGWLPGEIITDPHTLNFVTTPSPGAYRLIAGLYNPLTGQRLPVVNQQGQTIADAILVAELTLP